jgi:NTP pyrophosphatase (non-canonical NTP hydrolase)
LAAICTARADIGIALIRRNSAVAYTPRLQALHLLDKHIRRVLVLKRSRLPSSLSLDDLYRMTAHIYSDRNSVRSKEATFAHFVEVCGMLTIPDRKKKRENVDVADALCKALGWYFPLLAKLGIQSVEALVFRKFPSVCPYCRKAPHEDMICKQVRGTTPTGNHSEVVAHFKRSWPTRPRALDDWQKMFNNIYPRQVGDVGRSSLGLLEELGELAEAIRVFDAHPQYFLGEAADTFSYIMGLANEHEIRETQEERNFSFEREFLSRYPGLCTQCGSRICVCPAIPAATIGRMAKELKIGAEEQLFVANFAEFSSMGERAAHRALEEMGGYPGLVAKLPFDRGDTNQALVTVCLKIASAVESTTPALAGSLRAEAVKLSDSEKAAGTRAEPLNVGVLLTQLRELWKDLDETHRATIKSSPGMTGDLGEILDAETATRVRVLFVTCDPEGAADHLHLQAEQRAIKEALAFSPHGSKIHIENLPAATTDDLRRALLSEDYDIVHFSGHADQDVLVFETADNQPSEIPTTAVAELIGRYPSVKCVVLNACEAVKSLKVPISSRTIGMEANIPDKAAIEFSRGFYDALGAGKSIDVAYAEGVSAMKLASYDAAYVRMLGP